MMSHVTECFCSTCRAVSQSWLTKKRALSAIPGMLSCELPATPGWPDQYAIAGESHHCARNERLSDERKFTANSCNRTDSLRCSILRTYSDSLGQSCASQSRKIGKSDTMKIDHTRMRDRNNSSQPGKASAKITTNTIQPVRRCGARKKSSCCNTAQPATSPNKISGSYSETQSAKPQAAPLTILHLVGCLNCSVHSAQIATITSKTTTD